MIGRIRAIVEQGVAYQRVRGVHVICRGSVGSIDEITQAIETISDRLREAIGEPRARAVERRSVVYLIEGKAFTHRTVDGLEAEFTSNVTQNRRVGVVRVASECPSIKLVVINGLGKLWASRLE